MGILDETATEDDYVKPESTWNMWDLATTPVEGMNAPDIIQSNS